MERRCLIIDEHPTVRLGARQLLGDRYEVEEAPDAKGALELFLALGEFDVVVVEFATRSGPRNGAPAGRTAVRALRKGRPGLGIVAHAERPQPHAAQAALKAGATAFVVKSSPADVLLAAVEAAADCEEYVDPALAGANGRGAPTRRQLQILQHYADGMTTAGVAKRLGVSTETVRTHTKGVLARLGARDRAHAVAIGIRNSLID